MSSSPLAVDAPDRSKEPTVTAADNADDIAPTPAIPAADCKVADDASDSDSNDGALGAFRRQRKETRYYDVDDREYKRGGSDDDSDAGGQLGGGGRSGAVDGGAAGDEARSPGADEPEFEEGLEEHMQHERLICAWLEKKSPAKLKGWQRRWFVLEDNKLMYFKEDSEKELKGAFHMTKVCNAELGSIDGCFAVRMEKRVMELRAESRKDAQAWVDNILAVMPVLRSPLEKKSPHRLKGWQRRFFVLQAGRLFYYVDSEARKMKGVIALRNVLQVQLTGKEDGSFNLVVQNASGEEKTVQLRAKNTYDAKQWTEVLAEEKELLTPLF